MMFEKNAHNGQHDSLTPVAAVRNSIIFVLSLVIIAGTLTHLAHQQSVRSRIDATRTRAYSLSPQTRILLDELQDQWTVALIFVRDNLAAAERRQIDEVLSRYQAASDQIMISHIDPTDAASLTQYERLLAHLRAIYGTQIAAYDEALDRSVEMFEELLLFARQESGRLQPVLEHLGTTMLAQELAQHVGALSILGEEGGEILTEVRRMRAVTDDQPIPDYDAARSTMAAAVGQTADSLVELAAVYERIAQSRQVDAAVRQFCQQAAGPCSALASRAAGVADPLRQLPEIELATIGRKLKEGDAAVVVGPDRAAVIDGRHLFPQISQRGPIAMDRRFRGEQLITATIRSLLVDQMPRVVFVHNEEESLFRRRDRNVDLVGVASTLIASRFDVREWIVSDATKPQANPGQPVVWVVVPPIIATPGSERIGALVRAARELISDGESVLLSVNPSRLPALGQRDAWVQVADAMDVEIDTAHVVVEQFDFGDEQGPQIERGHMMHAFRCDHPICSAVHGQQVYFGLPVPMHWIDRPDSNVNRWQIAAIDPSQNRWLERDWAMDPSLLSPPPEDQRLRETVPIALAFERSNPAGSGRQRGMVVSSGSWMLGYVADAVVELSGGRVALTNPGNQELLLAAVAWLSEMDELIAPSPLSQQVARLDGINTRIWLTWFSIAVLGMPLFVLLVGTMVWFVRRN